MSTDGHGPERGVVMLNRIIGAAQVLHADESGAAMVEYAIITAVIAIVALSAAQSVGTSLVGVFTSIVTALTGI